MALTVFFGAAIMGLSSPTQRDHLQGRQGPAEEFRRFPVVRIEETPLGNNMYIAPSGPTTTPSAVGELASSRSSHDQRHLCGLEPIGRLSANHTTSLANGAPDRKVVEGRTSRRLRKKIEMLFAQLKRILKLGCLRLRVVRAMSRSSQRPRRTFEGIGITYDPSHQIAKRLKKAQPKTISQAGQRSLQ